MPSELRDVAREFSLGNTTLEALRDAARTSRGDRQVADAILAAIAAWESDPRKDSARVRNELRARIKQLAPPLPPPVQSGEEATMSMYGPGLRGQRRRG